MILVDTSVWVDHLRTGSSRLAWLLKNDEVMCHGFVIGELACGNLRNRAEILRLLSGLPTARTVAHDDVMALIEARRLYGKGIGWVDVNLLASVLGTRDQLWTNDRRLGAIASDLKIASLDV